MNRNSLFFKNKIRSFSFTSRFFYVINYYIDIMNFYLHLNKNFKRLTQSHNHNIFQIFCRHDVISGYILINGFFFSNWGNRRAIIPADFLPILIKKYSNFIWVFLDTVIKITLLTIYWLITKNSRFVLQVF